MHRPISFFQPSGARHDIRGQDSFSYPTVARSALGLGLQALLRRGTPGSSPCAPACFLSHPAQLGLECWTAQPRSSLFDATAKYQTTYQAFPESRCPQAELQACN